MELSIEKLKSLLVSPGHISKQQFDGALKEAVKGKTPLELFLVKQGLISDEDLGKIIADGFNYRFIDLSKMKISEELLGFIPEIVARAQKAIVFDRDASVLKLATPNPENYEFIKLLEKKTGHEIEVYYATPLGIEEALRYYKSDLENQVKKLILTFRTTQRKGGSPDEEYIVKLVNLFLEYAHDNRASDIHIEPLKTNVSVRFRIDGVLHKVASYPKNVHDKVVFRIKIMARLRTDEHGAAQDGRLDYKTDDSAFDVRVSVLPVTDGENIVLRLLAEHSERFSLEQLGFSKGALEKIEQAATKPYGMILAVGPTGSGKTTTLYAIVQILNKPEVNIVTIEDPVEYDIEHVQQTQVNPKRKLTFANGLRSIVRQDPDIIMVGEIRDAETADIAVNAAMTGHLLLSTLHSNDAATTFPRLIEMGVEPFLLASSVNVIVAQRLVRKICERCRTSYQLDEKAMQLLQTEPHLPDILKKVSGEKDFSKMTFYKGTGCKSCGDTGYSGRTGIFEVMEITDALRPLITQKSSSDRIEEKAKELGMTSTLHDGITKVLQGVTSLEELLRVIKS